MENEILRMGIISDGMDLVRTILIKSKIMFPELVGVQVKKTERSKKDGTYHIMVGGPFQLDDICDDDIFLPELTINIPEEWIMIKDLDYSKTKVLAHVLTSIRLYITKRVGEIEKILPPNEDAKEMGELLTNFSAEFEGINKHVFDAEEAIYHKISTDAYDKYATHIKTLM